MCVLGIVKVKLFAAKHNMDGDNIILLTKD